MLASLCSAGISLEDRALPPFRTYAWIGVINHVNKYNQSCKWSYHKPSAAGITGLQPVSFNIAGINGNWWNESPEPMDSMERIAGINGIGVERSEFCHEALPHHWSGTGPIKSSKRPILLLVGSQSIISRSSLSFSYELSCAHTKIPFTYNSEWYHPMPRKILLFELGSWFHFLPMPVIYPLIDSKIEGNDQIIISQHCFAVQCSIVSGFGPISHQNGINFVFIDQHFSSF